MKISKPIVVFDLETTGTWVDKDLTIEIAMVKCLPDGSREEYHRRVNPGIKIPLVVTELTGISNEDVKDAPVFKELGQEILDFIGECDIGGFNVERFDLPLLRRELEDNGFELKMEGRFVFDSQKVFHLNEKRDLTAALDFYCQKNLEGAHSALHDTRATVDVLEAQVAKYSEDDQLDSLKVFEYKKGDEFYDLERKFRWWNGELYMMFGKYARQCTLKEVVKRDRGYLNWMLSKDFSDEIKDLIENVLNGKYPNQSQNKSDVEALEIPETTQTFEASKTSESLKIPEPPKSSTLPKARKTLKDLKVPKDSEPSDIPDSLFG